MVIGAHVLHQVVPQGPDRAVIHHPQLDLANLSAPVNRGEEILRASFDPFHRLVEQPADEANKRFFTVYIQFAPKPPAHLRGNDPDLMFGNSHLDGDLRSQDVRDLRGRPEGQLFPSTVKISHRPTGLDRIRDNALIGQVLPDDPVGFLELLVHVFSRIHGEREVGIELFMDFGRTRLQGLFHIDDGWEGIVFHLHPVRTVPSDVPIIGDDRRNRLSHISNRSLGEDGVVGDFRVFGDADNRDGTDVFDVLPCIDGHDAG